jgi:hypothetical protein
MIWGQHLQPSASQPHCRSPNPLLLFEPRPAGPWPFEVKELAPQWQRHIERLQQGDAGHRTMN